MQTENADLDLPNSGGSDEIDEITSIKPGDVIQGRFLVQNMVGEGSFGQVYKVLDQKNDGNIYAIKVEEESDDASMLEREIKVLIELRKKQGFPQIKFYGQERGFTYCIMSLLGRNLESIVRKLGGTLSITTGLRIAVQMIDRIEVLHSCRFLHRDIKPDNFVLEAGNNPKTVYLIDFGLAKHYMNSKGDHISSVKKAGLIGTARYASIAAHEEMEQGRKDDLESIGYVLIYLITGTLPWMNLQIEQKDLKYARIHSMKKQIKPELLCTKLPQSFTKFMTDIRNLKFSEAPNYHKLKQYFVEELDKLNSSYNTYDWELLPEFQKKKHITVHVMQSQKLDEDHIEIVQNPKQQVKPANQTFEQMMEDRKKGTKKTLYSPTGKSKKTPIMINVMEPQSKVEPTNNLLAQPQPISRIGSYSNTFLQIPKMSSMQLIENYSPSLANNYEWSEKEVCSEGDVLPIWQLGNGTVPGFQQITGILRGIKKPSIVYQRRERKCHTQIDTIKTMSKNLNQPKGIVGDDGGDQMEGLD